MKTDFSINVNVSIGVTSEVVQLVTAILAKQPAQIVAPGTVVSNEPQPEPQAEAEAETNRELTEEDVREAMHKVRQRIEGENYKENTDSENYKKYHRVLTQTFKNISALLGSDKPSTLPADQRAAFINEINALVVNEKGEIAKPDAF